MLSSFRTYANRIVPDEEFHVEDIDAEMVHDTVRRTSEPAPGMDGWRPRELSLFSLEVSRQVAALFLLIEDGAPWPGFTVHARVIYLGNVGVGIGEVMSYGTLTMTSPLYRS